MPLLDHHCRRGESFDIMKSNVARWMTDQAEVRQLVFNIMRNAGVIEFVDGKWVGADTYAKTSSAKVRPS
jgi:hypothetical protein